MFVPNSSTDHHQLLLPPSIINQQVQITSYPPPTYMHTKAIRDARKVSHEARPPESNSGNGVHIFSPDYPTRVPEGGVAANTFPPRRYQI